MIPETYLTSSSAKQQPGDPAKPPLSLSTILRYTWGITMNLSSQTEQKDLSDVYSQKFDQFVANSDPIAKSFLEEVAFLVSGVTRSYGFEREVYMINIDAATQLWAHQISYYMNTTNPALLTGIPSDSAPSDSATPKTDNKQAVFNDTFKKIISFIGSGSGVSALVQASYGNWFAYLSGVTQSNMGKLINTTIVHVHQIKDPTLNLTLSQDLDAIQKELSANANSQYKLLIATIFVFAGAIGYGLYSLFSNRYSYNKVKRIDMEKGKALEDFWRNQMKPSLTKMYFDLVKELQSLCGKYYNFVDDSLPSDDNALKDYIRNKILPSDDCYTYRSTIK